VVAAPVAEGVVAAMAFANSKQVWGPGSGYPGPPARRKSELMDTGMSVIKRAGAALGLAMLAVGPAYGAAQATTKAIDTPNFGQHMETVEDLKVKVLGGFVRMKRTWIKGQWDFNRRWNGLSARRAADGTYPPGTTWGTEGTLEALIRNGTAYEQSGDNFVPEDDPTKRIVPLDGGGYRWEDNAGNWIRYNAERRAVAYGDRNAVRVTLERDADGKLTGVLDHHGNRVLTLTYNADGRLIQVEDRAGRTVSYAYTDRTFERGPKLAEVTDVRGNGWSYEYSGNRLIAKTDPLGRTTKLAYHANGTLKSKTDPAGHTTASSYEYQGSQGKYIKRVEEPGGLVRETTYNEDGEPTRVEENGELVREYRHGDRKKITIDAAGNRTVREYDEWDNLVRVTYPDGASKRFEYRAGTSRRTKTVNELGVVTKYAYDADGNRTRVVEAAGTDAEQATSYDYDQYDRVTTVTREGDAVTEAATIRLEYDQYGNVTKRNGPEGGVQQFSHNVRGQVIERVDARGETWTKDYDPAGNLVSRTDPLGNTTTFDYDKVGNRIARSDPLGNTTSIDFDANDRRVATTDPAGGTTKFAYDAAGRLIKVTDPTGVTRTLEYDNRGRLAKVIDGAGNTTAYAYDQSQTGDPSLRTAVIYPTYQETYGYDARGRRTRTTKAPDSPVEQVRKRAYDAGGRVVAKTDPKGRTTRFEYDALGRKVTEIDPAGGVTKYGYDDRDNLISVTNARGIEIRRFEYDRADRRTAVIWPGGETVKYRYDGAGNLVEKINARGQAIRHTYDDAGRRVKSAYHTDPSAAPGRTETFTYDAAGRLTAYTGSTTSGTYTYDAAGRRTGATIDYGDFTKSYGYTYYPNGKKRSFTAPDGTTYSYRYDEANRLKGIRIPDLGEITYHDYQWRKPTRVSRPGGGEERKSFDRLQRVKEIRALDPAGNPLMDYDYTYDQAGNITTKATEHGHYTYDYDRLDRLTEANNPDPLNDEAYTYDPVGNRKTDSQVPGEWTYNRADQLTSYGKYTQEFDADGNLVKKTNTETGTVTEYRYNVAGRLVKVVVNGSTLVTFAYDPFGKRVTKQYSAKIKYYLNAEEGIVSRFNSKGDVDKFFIYKPSKSWGENPVLLKKQGEYLFYNKDHLGLPWKILAKNGSEKWIGQYAAFGKSYIGLKIIENDYRFQGQIRDSESSLNYNLKRYYSPDTGRYITRDVKNLKNTKGKYSYANSNPINYIDPKGMDYQKYDYPDTGEPSACDYYRERCEASRHTCPGRDEYACNAEDCCRSFGDSPEDNCTRKCLIKYDIDHCIRATEPDRSTCRTNAHVICYTKCFNYQAFMETPRPWNRPECQDAMDSL